jgi:glycosyltransferase involved in cell wall biosynthesis
MKRVLLVQPSLQPPGGGNGVAAWILEALKCEFAVSTLTWQPVDLAPINDYYGTSLRASEIDMHGMSPTVRTLVNLIPVPLSLLKSSLLLRTARKMRHAYDVIITANNEADFGCKGIQYIHFPWGYLPRPHIDLRWYHLSPALNDAYYRFCVCIADFSFERMTQNLTLVNSDWTAAKVRERYGIDSLTLYPALSGNFPDIPWEDRRDGFVCIGRIAPEKELAKVIDVVAAVRARGRDVHLHLVGRPDNRQYHQHIRHRARAHTSWIFLHENPSRDELVQMIAEHRYGIHGMQEEHFGMAVAELVRGGCIPFVPRGGGQVEIIGEEENLLYETAEAAVAKIVRVMDDAGLQRGLRDYLASRKARFSSEVFIRRLRDIVGHFSPPPLRRP